MKKRDIKTISSKLASDQYQLPTDQMSKVKGGDGLIAVFILAAP